MNPNEQAPLGPSPQPVQPEAPQPVAPTSQDITPSMTPQAPVEMVAPPAVPSPSVTPVAPQSINMPSANTMAAKNGSKMLIMIVGAVVLLAMLGGVAAMVMSKKSKNQSASTAAPASSAVETPEPDAKQAPAASGKAIAVNKTITDDVMGTVITVESYSIGEVAIPQKYAKTNSDKTVVLLKITTKTSGKYAGGTNILTKLLGDGEQYGTPTSLSDDDIKKLGYPVYDSTKPTNNSLTGYKAYWIKTETLDKLNFVYKRQAAGVINTDETISAKEYTLQIL